MSTTNKITCHIQISKEITWEGVKPWYVAYVGQKFEVSESSITHYALTDKDWCQKNLGSSTAYVEKRHCFRVSTVPQIGALVETQVEKFKRKYTRKFPTNTKRELVVPVVEESKETYKESDLSEYSKSNFKAEKLVAALPDFKHTPPTPPRHTESIKPALGVMPRFLFEEMRRDDLKRAILDYVGTNCKVSEEWIEEYNELVERINKREAKHIDLP